MRKMLKLPKFKNELEEQEFWAKFDASEYFEASDFVKVKLPNLKYSSKPISIRLPEPMLLKLRERANSIDVPYQALIKQYIARGLDSKI